MLTSSTFPDASRLYMRRLIADRCLLAVAKFLDHQSLEQADIEALEDMKDVLQDVSRVENGWTVGSLSADSANRTNMILQVLFDSRMVSTLSGLGPFLRSLSQALSHVATGEPVDQARIDQLAMFLEQLSSSAADQIAATTSTRIGLAYPSWG